MCSENIAINAANHQTFCCDNLWKSIIMALEKPGKLREFFLLVCGHPVEIGQYFTKAHARRLIVSHDVCTEVLYYKRKNAAEIELRQASTVVTAAHCDSWPIDLTLGSINIKLVLANFDTLLTSSATA